LRLSLSRLNHCYRRKKLINSANAKIEMTAEQIFKEIEAFVSMETALNETPAGRVNYRYRAVEKFWRKIGGLKLFVKR
jgi:hypothetical protein